MAIHERSPKRTSATIDAYARKKNAMSPKKAPRSPSITARVCFPASTIGLHVRETLIIEDGRDHEADGDRYGRGEEGPGGPS